MKSLHMKTVTRAQIEELRTFAEGRLRNALVYIKDGHGNPVTEIKEAIGMLDAAMRMVACDDEAPEGLASEPKAKKAR